MSIDKWLDKSDSEETKNREEVYNNLSKEEKLDLKKKKIKELKNNKPEGKVSEQKSDSLLNIILDFKNWLNQRTYIKGDLDKVETWIKILYKKFVVDISQNNNTNQDFSKSKLIEQYRSIPPIFLDEKTRIALNKLLFGKKMINSDNYCIRKLKSEIQEKLKEAKYYEILDRIIELK